MQSIEPLYKANDAAKRGRCKGVQITEKEKQILIYLCMEMLAKQIAPLVHLTKASLDTRLKRLRLKTGARNSTGLAMYAVRHRIFVDPQKVPTRRKKQ